MLNAPEEEMAGVSLLNFFRKLYSSSKKSFFAAPGYENEREESEWQTWSHHEERPIILANNLTNSDQKN